MSTCLISYRKAKFGHDPHFNLRVRVVFHTQKESLENREKKTDIPSFKN